MKYAWLVISSVDGSEDILSIHASREGATLAVQRAHAKHDIDCLSLAQKKKYKTWESDKDLFSCSFIDDDVSYSYSAFREEVLP